MENNFFTWKQFNDNFAREMVSATEVYERRKKDGIKDYCLAKFDFVYISDDKDKLLDLGSFLSANYGYEIIEIKKVKEYWELNGNAIEFPVNEDNLLYWALDLYCKGYEFDCILEGYGAMSNAKDQKFPDLKKELEDYYFNLAIEAYNNRNLGMAIIHFSTVIQINPKDPNSWYSRGVAKDELYTWKDARRDYDEAIALAPDFVAALINRAANKDEAEEYSDAILDYDKAIELDPQNAMAYFNRGNTKYNLADKKGAFEDWTKAKYLGADYAQKRLDETCE